LSLTQKLGKRGRFTKVSLDNDGWTASANAMCSCIIVIVLVMLGILQIVAKKQANVRQA
jgi:hypothetical protein